MKNIQGILSKLYSKKEISDITEALNIDQDIFKVLEFISPNQMHLYVSYPNSFSNDGKCDFHTLADELPRIKQLGLNAIHVLPPFESPMVDGGFDVSDYYSIRQNLGGNDSFDNFLQTAQSQNIKVFIDFVLNHISEQHDWFQKAIAGESYYQGFFIHSEVKPEVLEITKSDKGSFATYEIRGQKVQIRIMFPEQAGEIPHWVKHNDVWYYHTFYPQQIDLDWNNPNVFLEMAKVLIYWAQKGCDFRLDAIPHVGKKWEEGMLINNQRTHIILQALHKLLESINQQGKFLLEVSAKTKLLSAYCTSSAEKETDLLYNFELSEYMWVALLLGETDLLWEGLEDLKHIPNWIKQVTFLRNHDEMSLKYTDDETRSKLKNILEPNSLDFRFGYAISGRTASFLKNDVQKIILAHFLLASLPGNPALMYGDEFGKTNDLDFMREQKQAKTSQGLTVDNDTRDINRGRITQEDIASAYSRTIQNTIAQIFTTRAKFSDLVNTIPHRLELPYTNLFDAMYELSEGRLITLVNLSDEQLNIERIEGKAVLSVNNSTIDDENIVLPAFSGIWLFQMNEDHPTLR